jgi:DNA-directed RNA polymerase subunit K/omega
MEEKWSMMYEEGKSKYQIINVVAKRARQLNEGDRPLVGTEGLDTLKAAVAELRADKLKVTEIVPEDESESSGEEEES